MREESARAALIADRVHYILSRIAVDPGVMVCLYERHSENRRCGLTQVRRFGGKNYPSGVCRIRGNCVCGCDVGTGPMRGQLAYAAAMLTSAHIFFWERWIGVVRFKRGRFRQRAKGESP